MANPPITPGKSRSANLQKFFPSGSGQAQYNAPGRLPQPGQMASGLGAPKAAQNIGAPQAPPTSAQNPVVGSHPMAPPPSAPPASAPQGGGGGPGHFSNNTHGYQDPNRMYATGQGAWQTSTAPHATLAPMGPGPRPGGMPQMGADDQMNLSRLQAAAQQGNAVGPDMRPQQGRPVSPELLAQQRAYQQSTQNTQGRPVSRELMQQQQEHQQPQQQSQSPIELANSYAPQQPQSGIQTGTGSSSQALTANPGQQAPAAQPATPDYTQGGVDRNAYTASDPYAKYSNNQGESYQDTAGVNHIGVTDGRSLSDDYNALAQSTGMDPATINQMMQQGWHFYSGKDGFGAQGPDGKTYNAEELSQTQVYQSDVAQNRERAAENKQNTADAKSDEAWKNALAQADRPPPSLNQKSVDDLKGANTAQIAHQQSIALRAAMEGGARAGVSPESTIGTGAQIETQGGIAGAQMNAQVQMQAEIQNLQARMQQRQDQINIYMAAFQNSKDVAQRTAAYAQARAMQQQQYQDQMAMTKYQNDLQNQITWKDALGAVGGIAGTVGGAFAGAGAKKLFE